MRSSLLLLLITSFISAEVYTVCSEDIRHNRFFAITDLLEEVPFLETHVFDVADVTISAGGMNSQQDDAVLFCVDDLPIHTFHDGRPLLSQRLLQNYDIDSILIYTGPDVYRYSARAAAVVNIITKSTEAYQKRVFIKPYVGSEIGDPTLLKKILPADSIPLNKDQVLAGEASGAFIKKDLLFKGGISVELMDPYTSTGEGLRSRFYPEQNAHQSLLERKDGHFRFGLRQAELYSITSISAGDYRNFRYSPFAQRYYYYEGMNGIVRNRTTLQKERFSLNLSLSALYDDGDLYFSGEDSLKQKRYSGAGDLSGSYTIKKHLELDGHVALRADNRDHDKEAPIAQLADSSLTGTAHIGLQLQRSRLHLTYPLGIHFAMSFTEQLKGAYSLIYPRGSKSAVYETDLTWIKVTPSNTLKVTGTMKITPAHTYVLSNGYAFREYHESDYRTIPQLTVENNHTLFGRAYGNLSTFGGKFGISRDLPLQDIYFRGQLNVTLPTYWSGYTPLSYADRHSSESKKIEAYVVGNLALTYILPNRNIQLSAAIRNIGKKHIELPNGSIVGPVIVTNMEISF